MTTMVTRAAEGTTLSFTQLDGNFKRVAQAKTAGYTIAVGDNRDTIEFNGSSLTATLPAASTITTSADTGDFEVTIKNLNATDLTVARGSTDTIDGDTSLTLAQYQSATLKVNNAADGWNVIARSTYTKGSFTATGTGFSGTAPTATWKYTIVGNAVTLDMAVISGTSNDTAFTVTGIPNAITPATAKQFLVVIKDNAVQALGSAVLSNANVLTVYPGAAPANWTASGNKQLTANSVSYTLV